MEMWRDIRRRVEVEGASKRSIQREYGIHFQTLQKILKYPEPPGYRERKKRSRPKLGPFLEIIASILDQDKEAPKKQRHTAQRIFDRLCKEYGYAGGYTAVREAVKEYKARGAEVFVPLEHPAGEAQVDFGFADVEIAGERRKTAIFVMTLPYSDAIYAGAFPKECTETFQQGHVNAFNHFGGVPKRISYDNSKIAVVTIGKGRERKLTREFLRLQSHYHFQEHFCLVRRPNEKGHVETLVGFTRRNYLVPVPSFDTWEALNRHLIEACSQDLSRQLRGKTGTKAERLQSDRKAMLPLSKDTFEARRIEKVRANSLSLCRFDSNDYSLPTMYAHREVTAVGGLDTVKLTVNDKLVAKHPRSWDKEQCYFDPLHYLALLERKPGAFDFAKPLKDWELPESFHLLRRRQEADWGAEGTRQYIKVLRLLEKASVPELNRAIESALAINASESEVIRLFLETRLEKPVEAFSLDGRPHLQKVHIAAVDLAGYGALTPAWQTAVQQ